MSASSRARRKGAAALGRRALWVLTGIVVWCPIAEAQPCVPCRKRLFAAVRSGCPTEDISTIYLAAALRDNGGGQLIGSELEPAKVARARAHIDAAGLGDLVEIREGDALETLKDVGGEVDLALIGGAWSLYLPVLKLIEPRLRPGAVILAENAFAEDYLGYVRNPANGYIAQTLPIDEGRGNEFAVRIL